MIETKVRWQGGMEFIGAIDSEHPVTMDAMPKFGGKGAAPTPIEVLLAALGGCTGMDIVSILLKMGSRIDLFEIELRGEREETDPKVYRLIEIKYILKGEKIIEENVQKAIRLSKEKYCCISAMLEKGSEIRYTYRLED